MKKGSQKEILINTLARKVGLPVRGSVPFFNGKIPCRLWEFETPGE